MPAARPTLSGPHTAAMLLRVGLAFAFAYAAISAIREPQAWVGYMPGFVDTIINTETALRLTAIAQLVLAAWLLSGRLVRYAALAAFALLAGITACNIPSLIITFRDISLACAALALAALGDKQAGTAPAAAARRRPKTKR